MTYCMKFGGKLELFGVEATCFCIPVGSKQIFLCLSRKMSPYMNSQQLCTFVLPFFSTTPVNNVQPAFYNINQTYTIIA